MTEIHTRLVTPLIHRADAQDLMLFYNLPAFSKGDVTAFLSATDSIAGCDYQASGDAFADPRSKSNHPARPPHKCVEDSRRRF